MQCKYIDNMDPVDPIKVEAQDLLDSLLDDKPRLEKFITEPQGLIFDDLSRTQRHLPRRPNPSSLFRVNVSPLNTTLEVERELATGALLRYHEVEMSHVGKTAKTSTSMKRAPGPPDESIKGSSTSMPFWPGGMGEPTMSDLMATNGGKEIDFENDLEMVPPGFPRGMTFTAREQKECVDGNDTEKTLVNTNLQEINITQLLMNFEDGFEIGDNPNMDNEETRPSDGNVNETDNSDVDDIIDGIMPKLPSSRDVLVISEDPDPSKAWLPKTEWAEMVNVNRPVHDFNQKVPSMARKWKFELDTFQKQAILHMEHHESVFVAAHTSAGKTVVAEYAIALSLKHMTRAIYTSPIKALSNQKYREFKDTFEDVGLLTGDIQINPQASCLIMTTEILRSMLYNGSDTIRDLEWAIFDEVHYINDSRRGVVWEEVLIFLPQHVNIVLLSATVPNALEFADWVGRTKQKKIYVISTPKRPVPLEHYLYLGSASGNQECLFPIVKADGKLSSSGYMASLNVQKEGKEIKFGAKGPKMSLKASQEKNLYINVIYLLKKKDQLPVVVFMFSRKRCDETAWMISQDLTTASEKGKIQTFVKKCIDRLKESDRDLPQVLSMQTLLSKGIGIHHSGILPILKEVVELLFQKGLVKLLFATETFAMGVNMPARTVVFDAIMKFDGVSKRNLTTAEYIQMAGRAGRRGIDTTGMVVVLCKNSIPELSELNAMMLGKPTILESRFRLTYRMILNLHSVENITVQDVMRRSFFEVENQKMLPSYEKNLHQLKAQIATQTEVGCTVCWPCLKEYYNLCDNCVLLKLQLQEFLLGIPQALLPGRVIIISPKGKRHPRYAVVLRTKRSTPETLPEITVLATRDVEDADGEDRVWPHYRMAHRPNIVVPDVIQNMEVIKCDMIDILLITKNVIRIDAEKVINNWVKREIPRFKDDPPSESFMAASNSLLALAAKMRSNPTELDPINDLGINNIHVYNKWTILKTYKEHLKSYPCRKCVAADEHFHHTYKNMKVQKEAAEIQQLCNKSLALQPDYEAMVEVLKELKYIDSSGTVTLKGRVAKQISDHELIITELILENVLTEMQPAEIVALLSSMVFQEQRSSEPNLNEALQQGANTVVNVATRIARLQLSKGMLMPIGDFVSQFNFNLAEVVYEWARGTTFTDITSLTDVQEGVIVRSIQRLDEILRDVKDAAKMVGNPVLHKKMEEASQVIKRDIVFAASLYTQ